MRTSPLAAAALVLGLLAFPSRAATGGTGSFDRFSFTNDQGTRTYKLYVPPTWHGQALPLIVELHGCSNDADIEARMSRLNEMAAKRGILVAYPEETGKGCWAWFNPADQKRDAGEPSIIAGITRTVQQRWHGDLRRTFIAGFSAGAGMAVDVAFSYPDLYASGLILAGCEYMGTTCTGGPGALPPAVSGELAYTNMGNYARVVPLLVVDGTLDPVVPPEDGVEIAQAALQTDGDVEKAAGRATPMSRLPSSTRTDTAPGGVQTYVSTYLDLRGCTVVEEWLVGGMSHDWPQDPGNGSSPLPPFNGPDLADAAATFFLHHPMPRGTTGCQQR